MAWQEKNDVPFEQKNNTNWHGNPIVSSIYGTFKYGILRYGQNAYGRWEEDANTEFATKQNNKTHPD